MDLMVYNISNKLDERLLVHKFTNIYKPYADEKATKQDQCAAAATELKRKTERERERERGDIER